MNKIAKKLIAMIHLPFISSIVFTIFAIITAIYTFKPILICGIIYGIISYLCINSVKAFNIFIKFILALFTNMICVFLASCFALFEKIFYCIFKEKANVGTEFGYLPSLVMYSIILIIVFILTFTHVLCKNKKNLSKKS